MEERREISKSGDFTYYADSYRNRIRSYRYTFSLHDSWRKKLQSLIFEDLMPLLLLMDKDWSLYVWNLTLRMKFCLLAQPEYTTIKTFVTLPVDSNYPTLHDGIFKDAYESLVSQIEAYEMESKSICSSALHLEFLADREEDKSDDDYDADLIRNCTII